VEILLCLEPRDKMNFLEENAFSSPFYVMDRCFPPLLAAICNFKTL